LSKVKLAENEYLWHFSVGSPPDDVDFDLVQKWLNKQWDWIPKSVLDIAPPELVEAHHKLRCYQIIHVVVAVDKDGKKTYRLPGADEEMVR
jgi:hypothetical protein